VNRPGPIPPGLIDTLEEPVWICRRDGTLVGCNRAAAATTGLTVEQLVGRKLAEVRPSTVSGPGQVDLAEGDLIWRVERTNKSDRDLRAARSLVMQRAANERLVLLAKVARDFATAGRDLPATCSSVARRLASQLGDGCVVRLVSEDGQRLQLVGAAERDPAMEKCLLAAPWQSVQEGAGGQAFRERRGVLLSRLEDPESTYSSPELQKAASSLDIFSVIAAPMVAGEQALGVISMGRRGQATAGTARPYTNEDLLLLEEVAHRAGLAVLSARNLEKAEAAWSDILRLTDALPVLIAITDLQNRHRFVSRAYAQFFQRPREHLVGATLREVLGAALYTQAEPFLDRAFDGETVSFDVRTASPAGGPMRDLRVHYLPQRYRPSVTDRGVRVISTGGSAPVGEVITLMFDVTDERQADRRKDEFLALLGHELRNPLAPILTALELLKLRGEPSRDREREVIERQVRHMVRLVDDLLDISRITRGKVQLRPVPCELAQVINKAVEMASPLFEQREHRLTLSVPRSGLLVLADPGRLAQVFSNLLTNAAKYTEPGGEVLVEATQVDDRAMVAVSDSGIGIPGDLLPTIFEPFVQGERSIDRAQGGLGLGLPLVRSLLALHGGEVHAHSDGRGRGSRFVVELPVLDANAFELAERLTPPMGAPAISQHAMRLLVVDDNPDAADLLAEALTDLGHHVEVAHDGPRALEICETFHPEVGILDIGLPVMDGYELARQMRLRESRPSGLRPMRLIALTGYGQETDRQASREAGFDVHLVKPVDLVTLTEQLIAD
jgi:signal transduction histidine kinase/CheY-like chemotaxis protein